MIPANTIRALIVAQLEQTNMENIDGMLAVADARVSIIGGGHAKFFR